MDFNTRSLLLSRILAGYFIHKNIKIISPDITIQYEANKIYQQCIEENVGHIFSIKELVEIQIFKGLWSVNQEKRYTNIVTDIEDVQVQLYKNYAKSSEVKKLRVVLENLRKEQFALSIKRNTFDSYSLEGFANFAKLTYILSKCTFINGKRKKLDINYLVKLYTENIISPADIRFLAHNQPWLTHWQAAKLNGQIFSSCINMDNNQQILLAWSRTYDNINESPDCPVQEVIDDDDMLDGFLISKRKESEGDKKTKTIEDSLGLSEKQKQSKEIFLIAETKEDAEKIDSLNSSIAKNLKNMRIKELGEKREVDYQLFKDVQKRLMMEQ